MSAKVPENQAERAGSENGASPFNPSTLQPSPTATDTQNETTPGLWTPRLCRKGTEPADQAAAAAFFQVRLGALVTMPAFKALAETRM